jgi:hypothetical protein
MPWEGSTRDVALWAFWIAAASILLQAIAYVVARPRVDLSLELWSRDGRGSTLKVRAQNFGSRDARVERWGVRPTYVRGIDLRVSDAHDPELPNEPAKIVKNVRRKANSRGVLVLTADIRRAVHANSALEWWTLVTPVSDKSADYIAKYAGDSPALDDESEWVTISAFVEYRPIAGLWPKTAEANIKVAVVH